MRFTKSLTAIAGALAIFLATGCAQIPSSGEVKRGPQIESGLAGEFLYYSPIGPAQGDSQEEVIRGFINAGTAPQNDYSTAREYLASNLKSSWNPSEATLVQRGVMALESLGGGEIQATTGVQAQVGNQGELQLQPEQFEQTLNFKVVRENGQWRISEAPNLTVVIAPVFDVIFEPYSLYFFDRQQEFLVPDVRWFPSRASTTTLITKAILEGPSQWLREGVVSAIPSGTNLAIDSVAIDNAIAQVDLTARALVAEPAQARRMRAQLRATLLQVPGVNDVAISIERSPQDIATITTVQPQQNSQYPIGLINNKLRQVAGNQTVLRNSSYALSKMTAKDFAISSDGSQVALRDDQGVWVGDLDSIGRPIELIDNRASLLTPAFDEQGYLWLTSANSTSTLVAYQDSGKARQIDAYWLRGMKRKAFALSQDGSRIVVLEQRASGNRLWAAVVVRDGQGQPLRLGDPIELTPDGGEVISVSWDDESSLAVLTEGTILQQPKVIRIGGLTRDLPTVKNGVKILANTSDGSFYILTDQNELLQYRSGSWSSIETEVTAVHFGG